MRYPRSEENNIILFWLPRARTLNRCIWGRRPNRRDAGRDLAGVFIFSFSFFRLQAPPSPARLPVACLLHMYSPPSPCVSAGANDSQRSSNCRGVGPKSRKNILGCTRYVPKRVVAGCVKMCSHGILYGRIRQLELLYQFLSIQNGRGM